MSIYYHYFSYRCKDKQEVGENIAEPETIYKIFHLLNYPFYFRLVSRSESPSS